jgi:hypothetical protein
MKRKQGKSRKTSVARSIGVEHDASSLAVLVEDGRSVMVAVLDFAQAVGLARAVMEAVQCGRRHMEGVLCKSR